MIIYSCNPELRDYEYGVYFHGSAFNTFSLPLFYSFRIKNDPIRFDSKRTIGIRCSTDDYQKCLRKAAEFATKEGISAIAVPCPQSLALKDVSSLNESLGDIGDKINIRIILNKKYLGQINAENDNKIFDYVKSNYQQRPSIQFSYHKSDIRYSYDIDDGVQFSLGETTDDELEKNRREREERYRKANDYSDHVKVSFEELKQDLEEKDPKLEKTFSDTLFDMIDERHADEVEIYKKANIDKRLFSKIRSNPDYNPSKSTVLSLCMALNLSMEETEILLNTIGASLSMSSMSDVIVKAFILNGIYDLNQLNLVLLERNLKPLTYY